ncbi:unnamed protein product [Rangifer tarandus platyrhynchus]|uniref:Uncharacterized protein n=1 Tax=Rangifer tarandus platyrhynchus TaxID=3082113 RepID=A0ACB1MJD8_RANTA
MTSSEECFPPLPLVVVAMRGINIHPGSSLVVQWLGLHALSAEGPGSIPGWGIKIPQKAQHGHKINKCISMIPRINIDKVILVSETFSIITPKKKNKRVKIVLFLYVYVSLCE